MQLLSVEEYLIHLHRCGEYLLLAFAVVAIYRTSQRFYTAWFVEALDGSAYIAPSIAVDILYLYYTVKTRCKQPTKSRYISAKPILILFLVSILLYFVGYGAFSFYDINNAKSLHTVETTL